ncbi:NACHT, LRR and PYD domains-containing protein 1a allele 5-like isoform X1 [Chelonia mydas]|uniref:NACHT, LRR and PYD domains-containing protein 1a allele 5-like isoform X1 n=1 Tax=Chelonia mydas TaxID=8469 RepID=UPI0018A1CF03|nr:NACHT, LRR and PYD domains-containing protein 1a allele 5-like isoform X1 [Chelonia mydas]
MEGTGRQHLLQTLAGLGKDELQRWKEKLSKVPLKEGYQRIPEALLEGADPGALAKLLISYYGEEYGLQLALLAQALCSAEQAAMEVSRAAGSVSHLSEVTDEQLGSSLSALKGRKKKSLASRPLPLEWLSKLTGKKGKQHQASPGGSFSEETQSTPGSSTGTEAAGDPMREQGPVLQSSEDVNVLRDVGLMPPERSRFSGRTVMMKVDFPSLSLPKPSRWIRKLQDKKATPHQAFTGTFPQRSQSTVRHPQEESVYGSVPQGPPAQPAGAVGEVTLMSGKKKTGGPVPPVLEALGGGPGRASHTPALHDLISFGENPAVASAGSLDNETEPSPSSEAGTAEIEEIICQQTLLLSAGAGAKAAAAGETSLSEDPSRDPWGQDKCDLCPREEDPPEEIHPETVRGPDRKQETYRIHIPGAGSFRCSETELGFEVRAAVTIQYRYDSWDQHLSASEKQQWMVSGPLFNIQVEPARAVAAVHLPHFLCLAGGEVDASRMRIAHFVDGRMTLEEPTGVRPFHAVLENPSFSPLGVLWRKIQSKCQAKVHTLALLYRALRSANTTLHLYLIPNDHSLRQAVNDHEFKCPSVRVHKPSRTKPLKFGSCCVVSSSSQLEVIPEELEFCYLGPKMEQPYLEIYIRDMQEGLQLSLLEKIEGEPIWKALVRPEDVMVCVSSAQMQTEEHFIDQHREQLIQRVRQVDGVLDKLYNTVLDNEQYQSIRAERTDPEKMRKLFDLLPSWNQDCKDQLYQVLEAKQKFLIRELKGT